MKVNARSDFHLKIQILLSLKRDATLHYRAALKKLSLASCFLGIYRRFDNLINAKKFHLVNTRWMCLKAVNPIKHLPGSERSEMPPRHRIPAATFPSVKRHI